MKDYKQQLKEEFENKFCHLELSNFVPEGKHYVLNSGWTSLALWNWISTKLDELEAKTRRDCLEGKLYNEVEIHEEVNIPDEILQKIRRETLEEFIRLFKQEMNINENKICKSWEQTLVEGNEEGKG